MALKIYRPARGKNVSTVVAEAPISETTRMLVPAKVMKLLDGETYSTTDTDEQAILDNLVTIGALVDGTPS